MASLAFKICVLGPNTTGSLLTVKDGTGELLVSDPPGDCDNPNGWDVTTALRENWELTLLAERVTRESRSVVPVKRIGLATDLEVKFEVSTPNDGFYDLLLVAAPAWNSAQGWSAGRVVHFEQQLYEARADVPVDTLLSSQLLHWKPLISLFDYPLDKSVSDTGAYFARRRTLQKRHSERGIALKAVSYAKENNCSDCCEQNEKADDFIWNLIDYSAAVYAASFGDFVQADSFIQKVEESLLP